MFKQILSDRDAVSWLPQEFKSDNELLESVEQCYRNLDEQVFNPIGKCSLTDLLSSLSGFDLSGIYLDNNQNLAGISQRVFGAWDSIKIATLSSLEKKNRESAEQYEARKEKCYKSLGSFSLLYIKDRLDASKMGDFTSLTGYFKEDGKRLVKKIECDYANVRDLLNTSYPEDKNLRMDRDNVARIKSLLDSLKELQRFIAPLSGKGDEGHKDERFYGEFMPLCDILREVTRLYDKVRNYLTRKPYSEEKIKLNFDNTQLLAGWAIKKERDNSCSLLRNNGKYYLVILDKTFKSEFKNHPLPVDDEDAIEKMNYVQVADPAKDIQNLMVIDGSTQMKKGRKEKSGEFVGLNIQLEEYKNKFLPPDINQIRKRGSYLVTNASFSRDDLAKFIDYYKERIVEYESDLTFNFRDSSEYASFAEFTDHINQQAYQIRFSKISRKYINELVDKGKIYLFQIYNKDFSDYSKGTPNMHTLYWRMLFDERNLADVVYKLDGGAEVFYRKKSIEWEKPTHPAKLPIQNKNPNAEKRSSCFDYDLIKDKRYTVDNFFFHVPITINFKGLGMSDREMNLEVRRFIHSSDDLHIIGIDRGERHLLYLSLIDLKGNIVDQFSLNIVSDVKHNINTDYHQLLSRREEDRNAARLSWQTIEGIKDLKEGYLSQVIHLISDYMVRYNAIVVLEDLNIGFKRGRQKVEKSVYQIFEKKLIDKLNCLVNKKADPDQPAGLLNALQLTNKFKSFTAMGKQNGFIFYIPAWNTSKMDPVTGFVNLFDTRYQNIEQSKEFFSKFKSITYNASKDWFEFDFDYSDFNAKAEGTRTSWTVCTQGKRILTFRNPDKNSQWDNIELELTSQFKNLLRGFNLIGDIKPQILAQNSKDFFEKLLGLFKLTLQMRNSITNSEVDYLVSPVADSDGNFYNSDTCPSTLPNNADANGAYNIARKGLWVVNQIKSAADLSNVNLAISNKDWLRFIQNREYLDE